MRTEGHTRLIPELARLEGDVITLTSRGSQDLSAHSATRGRVVRLNPYGLIGSKNKCAPLYDVSPQEMGRFPMVLR